MKKFAAVNRMMRMCMRSWYMCMSFSMPVPSASPFKQQYGNAQIIRRMGIDAFNRETLWEAPGYFTKAGKKNEK